MFNQQINNFDLLFVKFYSGRAKVDNLMFIKSMYDLYNVKLS